MSERGGGDGAANGAARESRRPSFRRALNDAALPPDFLDALEQKRKQLDDSIHKYIAAKEREFKSFERELRLQSRPAHAQDTSANDGGPSGSKPSRRRLSTEAAPAIGDDGEHVHASLRATPSSTRDRKPETVVENGAAKPPGAKDLENVHHNQPSSGPGQRSRRASTGEEHWERTSSAPDALEAARRGEAHAVPAEMERSNSDSIAQAKLKRPAHIELLSRTSSSGSSADGRLASAMKSPAHRPKGKRVSLQVGDEIVTPSEPVPDALHHYSTSSHSRTRSLTSERERLGSGKEATTLLRNVERAPSSPSPDSMGQPIELPPPASSNSTTTSEQALQELILAGNLKAPSNAPSLTSSKSKIDPDGDLFDLEAEDSDLALSHSTPDDDDEDNDDHHDNDDDLEDDFLDDEQVDISRRVNLRGASKAPLYDPEAGLVLPKGLTEMDTTVVQTDMAASQQPTQPGFRRPSVVRDPVYMGPGYDALERAAVEQDIYGSAYSRSGAKGSFASGSLGESYMEKNAEELMRLRKAAKQAVQG